MKIAIVSDSHGDLFMLDKSLKLAGDVDKIIHLGDFYEDIKKINEKYNKEIIYVAGNNDKSNREKHINEKVIDINGVKIFLTHGHRYDVYNGIDKLYYKAMSLGVNIVLFGHTHINFYQNASDITFFNPGSVAYPRDATASFGILDIKEDGRYAIETIKM